MKETLTKYILIMPLPKPTIAETRKDFMTRCMSNTVMINEFRNTDQRLAVCSEQYKKK